MMDENSKKAGQRIMDRDSQKAEHGTKDSNSKKTDRAELLLRIARTTAWISGAVAMVMVILVLANYLQNRAVDPLNSPALTTLMSRLNENPEDQALKEQIRALDLRARKAYFTSQWQVRTGGYLIFFSVLVMLASLKWMAAARKQLPDLEKTPEEEKHWAERKRARAGILTAGGVLVLVSLLLVIWSDRQIGGVLGGKGESGSGKNTAVEDETKGQWPAFRGPGANAVAVFEGVPTEWDGPSGKNILWKTEIPGSGFNSPVRWNDRIFLSAADEKTREVYCFDTETGKVLWVKSVEGIEGSPSEIPKVGKDTGYAAPSAALDGRFVFVIFANGDIVCLDFDGNLVWSRNLGIPQNHYGHSSSLIAHGGSVIVQYDQTSDGHLYAFDAETGEIKWETMRDVEVSWSSPVLVNTGKRFEVIINANPLVASYDPLTGRELWSLACMSGEVAPSPCYADGRVYALNDYAVLAAIKPGSPPEILWENDEYLSDIASPVATSEYLFVATSYGDFFCLDAKNGTHLWTQMFDKGFYASPVIMGDLVYALDLEGLMHIFRTEKTYQSVSECALGEPAFSTPAFGPGRIYIRGEKHLYGIGSADGS